MIFGYAEIYVKRDSQTERLSLKKILFLHLLIFKQTDEPVCKKETEFLCVYFSLSDYLYDVSGSNTDQFRMF